MATDEEPDDMDLTLSNADLKMFASQVNAELKSKFHVTLDDVMAALANPAAIIQRAFNAFVLDPDHEGRDPVAAGSKDFVAQLRDQLHLRDPEMDRQAGTANASALALMEFAKENAELGWVQGTDSAIYYAASSGVLRLSAETKDDGGLEFTLSKASGDLELLSQDPYGRGRPSEPVENFVELARGDDIAETLVAYNNVVAARQERDYKP